MANTIIPNLFTPSANDQSMIYLGRLFGTMTTGTTGATLLPAQGTGAILGYMFGTFNTIVLSVGALVLIYMTVMGVVMTAHEGEFMKKWNSLWGPLRSVFGIALLFPTATGYSSLQIIMMWFILQGVGAADAVWDKALHYVNEFGSVYAQVAPPSSGIQNNIENMFKALVCEQTSRLRSDLPLETLNGQGAYYCNLNTKKPFCQGVDIRDIKSGYYQFGPDGGCGKMHTCNVYEACDMTDPDVKAEAAKSPNGISDACTKCQRQADEVTKIMGTLRGIANDFVLADFIYMQNFYTGYAFQLNGGVHHHVTMISSPPPMVQAYCDDHGILSGEGDIDHTSAADDTPAECHGTINYDYTAVQTAQANGSLLAQSQDEDDAKETAELRGALPDARLGENGPDAAVVSDIIWPYYLMSKYVPGVPLAKYDPSTKVVTVTVPVVDINTGIITNTPQTFPSSENPMTTAALDYASVMGEPSTAEEALKDAFKQADNAPLTGPLLDASNQGWIFAGAYYYQLVADNSSKVKHKTPVFEVIALNPASGGEAGGSGSPDSLKNLRNNFTAASVLVRSMAGNPSGQFGAANTDFLSSGTDAIGQMMYSSTNPNSGSNPLVQVATAGYALLLAAEIIFLSFILLTFLFGLVSGLDFFVLGTGANNPMSVAGPMIWMILVPVMSGLLGLMVSMGATLGVYVPLIPYVMFLFGALGWLISTVEAMVAGPIVALGILAPGGHHELLGKAEPALMLLFGIFLRPTLMIFGLITAMLMASIAVDMVNATFWPLVVPQIVLTAISGGQTADTHTLANKAAIGMAMVYNPLMMIMFLIAYVGLIVAVLNKAFAAIHIIPERVMRWIQGGQGDSHGEGEAAAGLKSSVAGGASGAGSAMGQGAKGAKDMKETQGKVQDANKQINKRNAAGVGT